MSNNAEDMDEFIVYEMTKEEEEEPEEEYQDTEVIEIADEEHEADDSQQSSQHSGEPQYVLASTVVAVHRGDGEHMIGDGVIMDEDSQMAELQLTDDDEQKYKVDVEHKYNALLEHKYEAEEQDDEQDEEKYAPDDDEQHLDIEYQQLEDVIEEEALIDEEGCEEEQLIYEADDVVAGVSGEHEMIEVKKSPNADSYKGPKRYLLYDDLIATVVDCEVDNTPIVEFSISGCEADEKLPVECGICPDVMHKMKLVKHLKTHLLVDKNRYKCIYCDETYKDYKYLAGHARRHMGIRPYVCEPCKLYFSTKQDLRVHNQRRHHVKEHICEICGKTFAQNTQLKRHRESTHEKKRRFACVHCPKAYYKNFALQEHIRAVHEGNRRMLVCPFCGMQCRDAHKMARHRKELHLNQSHYECQICQEEFTDISYFDAHKRSIQCRNNTRRKLQEEEQQAQQQMDEHVVYEITLDSNETIN